MEKPVDPIVSLSSIMHKRKEIPDFFHPFGLMRHLWNFTPFCSQWVHYSWFSPGKESTAEAAQTSASVNGQWGGILGRGSD